jgi:hypothetical protein
MDLRAAQVLCQLRRAGGRHGTRQDRAGGWRRLDWATVCDTTEQLVGEEVSEFRRSRTPVARQSGHLVLAAEVGRRSPDDRGRR